MTQQSCQDENDRCVLLREKVAHQCVGHASPVGSASRKLLPPGAFVIVCQSFLSSLLPAEIACNGRHTFDLLQTREKAIQYL